MKFYAKCPEYYVGTRFKTCYCYYVYYKVYKLIFGAFLRRYSANLRATPATAAGVVINPQYQSTTSATRYHTTDIPNFLWKICNSITGKYYMLVMYIEYWIYGKLLCYMIYSNCSVSTNKLDSDQALWNYLPLLCKMEECWAKMENWGQKRTIM